MGVFHTVMPISGCGRRAGRLTMLSVVGVRQAKGVAHRVDAMIVVGDSGRRNAAELGVKPLEFAPRVFDTVGG